MSRLHHDHDHTIGVIGVVIFTSSFVLASFCSVTSVNTYTKRIFILMSFSLLFDLPTYFEFVAHDEYVGQVAYAFHLLSNFLHFTAFSCLCFSWGDALRAKNLEELFEAQRRIRMRWLIFITNIIFGCHTLVIICICLSSPTLEVFFDKIAFTIYHITDTFKNFVMGIFIFFFGNNLYQRMKNYSAFYDRSAAASSQEQLAELTKHLLTAADKLKYLVLILNICFSIRLVAIIIWMTSNAETENQPPSYLPPCSIVYWCIMEVVPTVCPVVALSFTMGSPAKILGGVFIDENKTAGRSLPVAQPRYSSDSELSDTRSSDMRPHISALTYPILGAGNPANDEEKLMFNRLSRISGEMLDFNRCSEVFSDSDSLVTESTVDKTRVRGLSGAGSIPSSQSFQRSGLFSYL
jgi:hypothetical protein